MESRPSFAYLFERFPSFTQTFCAREVEEMFRQGMNPLVISIRSDPELVPSELPASLAGRIKYLPPAEEMAASAKRLREDRALPGRISHTLGRWGEAGDKMRAYEAIHLGPQLKAAGVTHIHAHFGGIAARAACWIRRFYGIPFSFTGHANDIFCANDYPIQLEDLVQESRFVATETDFSRDWLKKKVPAASRKIFRVYNGIDTAQFPSRGALRAQIPEILSVGRCIEKKGFGDLISAARILKERGIRFRVRIVGEGPLEETLRAQIIRDGVGDAVEMTGPKSQSEIRALLAAAAVFVLPCAHEKEGGMDNLPTVIMEAMAACLPVISTPIAGVPEMVLHERTGFLVPENSPEAVADAIQKLIEDPALAELLGNTGKDLAREKFDIAVTTRGLKRLLVHTGKARPGPEAIRLDPDLHRKWMGLCYLWRS